MPDLDFKKLVTNLGYAKGQILVPHIDMWLQTHAEDFFPTLQIGQVKIDDGFFHPSSHPLMDEDALFDDRVEVGRRALTAAQKKTFDCGHFWHGYLQTALVEMGFVEQENVEKHSLWDLPGMDDHPMKISGTVDLLDVDVPGKGKWLVDIKTTSEFDSIEQQTGLYNKYVAQVNIYGERSGREKMMILVVEKTNPHRLREIEIQRDNALLAEIYSRWGRVAERLDHVGS